MLEDLLTASLEGSDWVDLGRRVNDMGPQELRSTAALLDSEDALIRERAAVLLGWMLPIPTLLKSALDRGLPEPGGSAAARALYLDQPLKWRPLPEAPLGPKANTCREVIWSERRRLCSDRRTLQWCLESLQAPEPELRSRATRVLAEVVKWLLPLDGGYDPNRLNDLLRHPDPRAAEQLAARLQAVRQPSVAEGLAAAIGDPQLSPEAIQEGMSTLSALAPQRAVPAALAILEQATADEPVLAAALRALETAPESRFTAVLAPYLEHPGPDVRREAVLSLAACAGEDAIPLLAARVHDGEYWVASAAAAALASIPSPASAEILRLALKDADSTICENAILALNRTRNPFALPLLLDAVQGKIPVRKRFGKRIAIMGLGRLGGPAVVPLLEELLHHRDTPEERSARCAALTALGQMENADAARVLREVARDADSSTICCAPAALAPHGNPEVLVARMTEEFHASRRTDRYLVALALLQMGEPGFQAVVHATEDPDPVVRESAANVLDDTASPAAVGPLTRLLRDPDPRVRGTAALRLGDLVLAITGGHRSPLYHMGVNGYIYCLDRPYHRWEARPFVYLEPFAMPGEVPQEIGGVDVVQSLIEAADDPEDRVRWMVIRTLGRIRDPRAIPTLIRALGDRRLYTASYAAASLALLRDAAVEPVCIALEGGGWATKLHCARILGSSGSGKAIRPLSILLRGPDWTLRMAATHALGHLGPAARARVSDAVDDEHPCVREAARLALTRITLDSECIGV